MEKRSYASAVGYVLDNVTSLPVDVTESLTRLKASLDKRAATGAEKKDGRLQENMEKAHNLRAFLLDNRGSKFTASDLFTQCGANIGVTSAQGITYLANLLISDTESGIGKVTERRRVYYKAL